MIARRGWKLPALLVIVLATDCSDSDHPTAPDKPASQLKISGLSDLCVGEAATMWLFLANGRPYYDTATWSSSDPQVATITATGDRANPTSADVTALAPGSTTIRAEANGLSGTTPLSVTPIPAASTMAVQPLGEFGDTIQVAPGETFQLTSYAYGQCLGRPVVVQTALVTWTSTRPDLATVSNSGLVTAIAEGAVEIRASMGQLVGVRPFTIVSTPGTVTVRFIHAGDDATAMTLRPNTGAPVTLAFGDVREETLPAGTLQVTVDGVPSLTRYYSEFIAAQQFVGFLPAGTHLTLVGTANPYASYIGPVILAPLWDWSDPVPADSARVRVVLASGGYNVYFAPPGAPIGMLFLRGCYLDWPYGVTDYAARPGGAFDILLQEGKDLTGPVTARFPVVPQVGHATTYIITGLPSSLKVLTLVDR
jgi:hypothetical protein